MKNLFLAFALTTFVGSMATTAYAAVSGTEVVNKFDDEKKKKKKKKKGCATTEKGCATTEKKGCCSKKVN